MNTSFPIFSITAGFAAVVLLATGRLDAAGLPDVKALQPLLETHCFRCHNADKHKGGVDLTGVSEASSLLRKHKLWQKVLEQVEFGDMPPEGEDALPPADKDALLGVVRKTLAHLESDDPALMDPGPAMVRRLSRSEYNRAVRDLLGVRFDAGKEVGMPEESTGRGFENLAVALSFSSSSMEKYFAAADLILARLYSDSGVKSQDSKGDKAAYQTLLGKLPGSRPEREAAEEVLSTLARRAYRRPVDKADVDVLLGFYDAGVREGLPFPAAMRRALKPLLVAPYFLMRAELEESPANDGRAQRVSNLELASRLSFFLWSSLPDEELLAAAGRGELHDSAKLEAQVNRMLADPKAEALTEGFATRWVQLDLLAEARPSTQFFPAFNRDLKKAMSAETTTFITKLREEDRSVLELLQSDYTYVNEALAKHYGIEGVKGSEMRRVALQPEHHRGGLLGMGSVLALTSHTDRTSPTQRGKWVLEVIFGTPPAPPPPEAGVLKVDKKKKDATTFREKLAQHASDANCAGCHKKIDPLGFGLENYDPVGSWRSSGPGLDASGELPGGEKFQGADELKQIIWKRRDQFVRNLCGQLLSYALGRELDYYDERPVTRIQASLAEQEHRFSALVLGVVNSFPFQYRRPPAAAPAPQSATAATQQSSYAEPERL